MSIISPEELFSRSLVTIFAVVSLVLPLGTGASPAASAAGDLTSIPAIAAISEKTPTSPAIDKGHFMLLSEVAEGEQTTLKEAFAALNEGRLGEAEAKLGKSIEAWERASLPPDEVAGLYSTRAGLRLDTARGKVAQLRLKMALEDYNAAIKLLLQDDGLGEGARADPAELPRAYLGRAEVHRRLQSWKDVVEDLTGAEDGLDRLPRIQQTNPYLYIKRAEAKVKLGDWAGAADDALEAEAEFKDIGDKIRATIAASDAALNLYGSGDRDAAKSKMAQVFRQKSLPASNSPDDLPLLQELSRKEAELHLAFASDIFIDGQKTRAATQWESGCVRLEAYVEDAIDRAKSQQQQEIDGTTQDPYLAVAQSLGWTVGLPKDSPFLTQQPGQKYYYYKLGEQGAERRDRDTADLAVAAWDVDGRLGCNRFRDKDWVQANRPSWPPNLQDAIVDYTSKVPATPIKLPPKGSQPTLGEREFTDPKLRKTLGLE